MEVKMFNSYYVDAKDLNDVWFQLLWGLREKGRQTKITAGSYEGEETTRYEFDKASGMIHYPTTRPLAPIMPPGCEPVATDDSIEKYFWDYIMDGVIRSENEDYKYATWINGGEYEMPYFDVQVIGKYCSMNYKNEGDYQKLVMRVPSQVDWIIKHYQERGFYNNHCYIQVGYPESSHAYDIPYSNPNERQTSPCLRGIDTKIINIDGKDYLIADATFRSWDLYSAFPTNMGGITLLMDYIAENLGIEVGALCFNCIKLHVYSHDIVNLENRLERKE